MEMVCGPAVSVSAAMETRPTRGPGVRRWSAVVNPITRTARPAGANDEPRGDQAAGDGAGALSRGEHADELRRPVQTVVEQREEQTR
jgi:hypothetical protein